MDIFQRIKYLYPISVLNRNRMFPISPSVREDLKPAFFGSGIDRQVRQPTIKRLRKREDYPSPVRSDRRWVEEGVGGFPWRKPKENVSNSYEATLPR
jgi:hypothetical protein